MCISGYIFENRGEIEPFCEDKAGASYELIADFCRRHSVYVVYGFAERAGDLFFNSQNLVGPTGLLQTYRKTHLYEADRSWATPGDSGFATVDTELGRLGLGICMDLNFDDFVDYHIEHKTDVLCFSACWLDEGFPVAAYWLERLWGYEQTILMANSFGAERGTLFRGESAVISGGRLIASAPPDREEVILIRHGD
jgi:predicted amidohydrolase